MEARYIVDAEGRPVEAILNLGDLRKMLEASTRVAEAAANLERTIRKVAGVADTAADVEEYEEAMRAVEDARRIFAIAVGYSIGELEELEEDREALRVADEALAEIGRGEDEVIPLTQALREIQEGKVEADS